MTPHQISNTDKYYPLANINHQPILYITKNRLHVITQSNLKRYVISDITLCLRQKRSVTKNYDAYLSTMCCVVYVLFGVWMRHTSWVTTNDVEVCSSCHSSLGVPLHLKLYNNKAWFRIGTNFIFTNWIFTKCVHVCFGLSWNRCDELISDFFNPTFKLCWHIVFLVPIG